MGAEVVMQSKRAAMPHATTKSMNSQPISCFWFIFMIFFHFVPSMRFSLRCRISFVRLFIYSCNRFDAIWYVCVSVLLFQLCVRSNWFYSWGDRASDRRAHDSVYGDDYCAAIVNPFKYIGKSYFFAFDFVVLCGRSVSVARSILFATVKWRQAQWHSVVPSAPIYR